MLGHQLIFLYSTKYYSGKRFSYVFDGLYDGYDDGSTLIYIPTVSDPNVVYNGVSEGEVLSAVAGSWCSWYNVAPNSGQLPYTRQLDLRIAQEIPSVLDHKLIIYFDLLNVMNFINDEKGHSYFQRYRALGEFLNLQDLTLMVKL